MNPFYPRPAAAAPRVRALRRDLSACIWDGFLYCLMVGLGETYLAAFVLHLGLGPVLSGLITTVPVVAGAFLQLTAPWVVARVGSYPRFIAATAYIQAAIYVPFAALACFSESVAALARAHDAIPWLGFGVFALATLYWAVSLACGPAWTTLVGEIIPARIRPHYFGKRNRILQLATLIGLLMHGLLMQRLTGLAETKSPFGSSWLSIGFACMFLLAGAARAGSAYLLSTYSEPRKAIRATRVPLRSMGSRGTGGPRFLIFVAAMGVATQIAQPFFNPFMLEELRANPAWYAWLLAAAIIGKGLAQPIAGRWTSRHGASRPLVVGAWLMVPLPVIWLLTDSLPILLIAQLFSGAVWGMFELAVFLRNFEATHPDERMSVLANFNCLNESAKTAGSLVGGRVLAGSADPAYAWVFGVSAIVRFLAVVTLARSASSPAGPPWGSRHRA